MIFHVAVFAAGEVSDSFTVDGQLLQAGSGETPLLDAAAKIKIQILNPDKTCLLYEEEQTVNTVASQGYYNLQVGSALGAPKRTSGVDPGLTMTQVYQNTVAVTAANVPGQTCAGGIYTPTASDSRHLRVIVTPSATNIAETLSPDAQMGAVSQAKVAQTLQGYSPNQFLFIGTGDLTQANLQSVFATGNAAKLVALAANDPTKYVLKDSTNNTMPLPSVSGAPASPQAGQVWYDSGSIKFYNGATVQTLGVSGSGITSLGVGTGLTSTAGATISTGGETINVDVGTTAGKILQLDGSAKIPAVDGSLLTNLNGSAIQSGTIGGSTVVNTTGTLTAAGVSATSANFRSLTLTNATSQTLVIEPPASITGSPTFTWPGTTGSANQVLTTNGSGVLTWANPVVGTGLTSGMTWFGNGSNQAAARNINISDIKSTVAGSWFSVAGACAAGEQITYSSVSDTVSCQTFSLTASQVNTALGYTAADGASYVAKAGDTMSGGLVLPANGLTVGTSQLAVSGGFVGVGTATPAAKLHVQDGAAVIKGTGSTLTIKNGFGSANALSAESVASFENEGGSGVATNFFTVAARDASLYFGDTATPQQGAIQYRVDSVTPANQALKFKINSSERMRIDSSGNVGIGTSNPSSPLHISGSANGALDSAVENSSAGASARARMFLKNNNSDTLQFSIFGSAFINSGANRANGGQVYSSGAGGLSFVANNASGDIRMFTAGTATGNERLRIDSSGNVGIGTTSPTATLHLKDSAAGAANTAPLKFTAGTNLVTPENGAVEFDGNNLYLTTSGTRRTIATSASGSLGGDISTITNTGGSITMSPSSGNSVIVNQTTASTNTTSGALIVNGGAGISGALNVGGGISSMATTSASGGANVSSPPMYLQANYWNGAASAIDTWSITNIMGTGTNPTSTLTFDHPSGTTGTKQYAFLNGNVGIGTATPQRLFHLAGASATGIFERTSEGLDLKKRYLNSASGAMAFGKFSDDMSTSAEHMRIDTNGNVGIGTSSVEAQLTSYKAGATIVGASSHSALSLASDGSVNSLSQITFGKQPIGSYAPASILYKTDSATGFSKGHLEFGTRDVTTDNPPTERMRIDSAGNVGIGTTSASTRLEVAGGVRIGTEATGCGPTLAGTLRYNSGNVEYCNGSSWAAFGVSGAGITAFNGSAVSSHSFATPGTSGTAPAWSTVPGTGVHTLNIPLASTAAVTAGLISKTDYDIFNTKLGAVSNTASLANGKIWVGDGTGKAQEQTLSGDATITNAGVVTVAKIQNRDVATTAPTNGQVLTWNNTTSKWEPTAATGITALTGDVTASGSGSVAATIAASAVNSSKIADGTVGVSDLDFAGSMAINTGVVVRNGSQFFNKTCSGNETLIWSVANGWICSAVTLSESDPKIGSNTTNYMSKWNGSALVGSSVYDDGTTTGVTFKNFSLNNAYEVNWGNSKIYGYGGASGYLNFVVNGGSSSLYLKDGGNVGIGTASPSVKLEVASSSDSLRLTRPDDTQPHYMSFLSGSTALGYIGFSRSAGSGLVSGGGANSLVIRSENHDIHFNTNGGGAPAMTVTSGSSVGIGISSPNALLDVAGPTNGTAVQAIFESSNSTLGGIQLGNQSSNQNAQFLFSYSGANTLDIRTNYSHVSNKITMSPGANTAMTLLGSGNVGIGVTNPTYQLQLSTDSAAKPGTSTWTIASDERLKDIRAPFTRGLDAINGLNTIYFNYKKDNPLELPSEKEYVGIKAQDAQKVIPESVSTDEQGYLHVTNDSIIWTAVNAIKELYSKVLGHDREIASIRAESKAKDEKIKELELRLKQQEEDTKARFEKIEKMLKSK